MKFISQRNCVFWVIILLFICIYGSSLKCIGPMNDFYYVQLAWKDHLFSNRDNLVDLPECQSHFAIKIYERSNLYTSVRTNFCSANLFSIWIFYGWIVSFNKYILNKLHCQGWFSDAACAQHNKFIFLHSELNNYFYFQFRS